MALRGEGGNGTKRINHSLKWEEDKNEQKKHGALRGGADLQGIDSNFSGGKGEGGCTLALQKRAL